MGLFMNIINLGGKGCRSQDNIADGRFTAGIGVPVKQGEEKRACPAHQIFTGKEDSFPRHKTIIKNQI